MLRLPTTPAAVANSAPMLALLGKTVGSPGLLLYDDFALHPNTAPGEVFEAILGGTWEFLAAGGVDPSSSPRVLDRVLRGAPVGNAGIFYAKQTLPISPDEVGAEIAFVPAGGSDTQTVYTIAVGNFGAGWEGGFVHMSWLRDRVGVGTGFYSTASGLKLNPQKSYMLPDLLAADAWHVIRGRRDGANLVLMAGEHQVRISDLDISRYWGEGACSIFFEHYYVPLEGLAFELLSRKVWAARTGCVLPDSTPACDNMGSTAFPFDSAGVARARVDLTSLEPIGTGRYTVGCLCVVPDGQTLLNYENGLLMIGDASGNDNLGTGPQVRFVQNGSAATPELQIWHQDGVNNTRWCFCGQFAAGELLGIEFGRDAEGMFFVLNGEWAQPYRTVVSGAGAAVDVSIASDYIAIGSNGAKSFHGQILYAYLANCAIPRSRLSKLARSWRVPPEFQWATNATQATGSLAVGKCYRIVTQTVAGYWYAGSAADQEFVVTSTGTAMDLRSRVELVLLQTAITAAETVVQVGMLGFWDGTRGYGAAMWDLSSNAKHAIWAGAVAHTVPTTLPDPVETLVPLASEVSITTGTGTNVASRVLTAGTWLVDGNLNFRLASATVTSLRAGLSTTSATLPSNGTEVYSGLQTTTLSATQTLSPRGKVVTVAAGATATVYLVGYANFSAGAMTGFGSIGAIPLAK